MKNRRNRFLPQAADPASVKSRVPLAERPVRHLRWSAAISGASLRAEGLPRWRPATFIFGLHATRMLSLVRRVLNFRLSWTRLEQTLAVTNSVLAQPVLSVREGRPPASRDSRSQTPGPRAVPRALWQNHAPQTLFVERQSVHRIWLQRSVNARTLWLPSPAGTISLGLRPNAVTREASAPEMTTRITRRLRRFEEAPLSPEPRLIVAAAPARGFEEIVETPARKPYGDASPVHRSELGANGSIPSGINVTHLTDEVMRLIDRRLVAVRERMGKI